MVGGSTFCQKIFLLAVALNSFIPRSCCLLGRPPRPPLPWLLPTQHLTGGCRSLLSFTVALNGLKVGGLSSSTAQTFALWQKCFAYHLLHSLEENSQGSRCSLTWPHILDLYTLDGGWFFRILSKPSLSTFASFHSCLFWQLWQRAPSPASFTSCSSSRVGVVKLHFGGWGGNRG